MLALFCALAVSAVEAEKFGRVVVAMGSVTASRQGEAARTLKVGDPVYKGEKVATDVEGRAKFLLEDRSVISLGPRTELELIGVRTPEVPKTSVKLLFGRLWANVQKIVGADTKFDVATPNAVAGVRGTSFFADVKGGSATFSVANGTVQVQNGGNTQLLQALQQLIADGNGFGGITNLPPGALKDLIDSMSSGGGMSDADKLARLEALELKLSQNGDNPPPSDFLVPNNNNTLPPVNLDPAQTATTTLIRGRVEVVQP